VWPGFPAIDYNGFALFNKFVPTPRSAANRIVLSLCG
jgi:hypothetical protein